MSGAAARLGALFGANQVGAINDNTLTGKLGGFAAMAGDDTTSEEFAREYDVAAKEAVDGERPRRRVRHPRRTHRHLDREPPQRQRRLGLQTSRRRSTAAVGLLRGGQPVEASDFTPPSSLGGDNEDLPDFWNEIVDHLEGFAWPNADTGKSPSVVPASPGMKAASR